MGCVGCGTTSGDMTLEVLNTVSLSETRSRIGRIDDGTLLTNVADSLTDAMNSSDYLPTSL
jgi:hypothetical protein